MSPRVRARNGSGALPHDGAGAHGGGRGRNEGDLKRLRGGGFERLLLQPPPGLRRGRVGERALLRRKGVRTAGSAGEQLRENKSAEAHGKRGRPARLSLSLAPRGGEGEGREL